MKTRVLRARNKVNFISDLSQLIRKFIASLCFMFLFVETQKTYRYNTWIISSDYFSEIMEGFNPIFIFISLYLVLSDLVLYRIKGDNKGIVVKPYNILNDILYVKGHLNYLQEKHVYTIQNKEFSRYNYKKLYNLLRDKPDYMRDIALSHMKVTIVPWKLKKEYISTAGSFLASGFPLEKERVTYDYLKTKALHIICLVSAKF